MSWIKRRGQATTPNPPTSAPPVQMYNPNLHSNLQQSQWQQQDLQPPTNNWYNQTQNQQKPFVPNYAQPSQQSTYWNQPFDQQTGHSFNQNPPNHYSQPGYYENNSYQQNYTGQSNQPPQSQLYGYGVVNHVAQQQPQSNTDSWNWGWGDEDNSNVQNVSKSNTNLNINETSSTITGDETWTWSVGETNTHTTATDSNNKNVTDIRGNFVNTNLTSQGIQQSESTQENLFPKIGKLAEKYNQYSHNPQHISNDQNSSLSSVNYSENLQAHQTIATSPKHKKLDNLTPQWSTESQPSQDSSDLLHTSESDKSHMLSRSSTISESPISGHDTNPEAFIVKQEVHQNQFESLNASGIHDSSVKVAQNQPNYYRQDNYNLQQENREVLSNLKNNLKQPKSNSTPPPPLKNQTPPLQAPSLVSGDDLRNPYKGNLLQKTTNSYKSDSNRQNLLHTTNQLNYPVSLSPFNQLVNLETLPDNSEQPDSVPQQTHVHKLGVHKNAIQQLPENNEIAPINDRNQYLETGQLLNNEFNQSVADSSDVIPPLGFTRMVLGQIEQTDNNISNQDEPPPGLSRVVLGQTGGSSTLVQDTPFLFQLSGDGEGSESEQASATTHIRSATIGADIPSTVAVSTNINRSETIGADTSLPFSSKNTDSMSINHTRSTSSNYNNNVRETHADGANNLDETIVNSPVTNRRDSIEGEPQNSVTNLINSVRNLTVGENTTSGANSTLSIPERSTRRPSRQESTDSDGEPENTGHLLKDRNRRYHDKYDQYEREKMRNKYSPSPDRYRDKKYERRRYKDKRYDDDTDGYSDRDRNGKREEKVRREEFDKKYTSLKKDKEKDKRRKEHRSYRDYGQDDRRNDFYKRYDDEYDDLSRSRPSSRSDSLHDSYRQDRDRHRNREREHHRRHREPFNPYIPDYSYDIYNPYYQQYQYHYYENLRRTNPQAYADLYHKYYQQNSAQQTYGTEDRASVHSGRSSANEELSKDRRPFDQTDSSLYLEETVVTAQRLTPAKFSTAHVKASITSGHLVKIFPHYPLDGQTAAVEISSLHDLLSNDEEYKDLLEFPGPFIKDVTHKKTIIEFCENKIRNAICNNDISDVDSYILMWELLILLLRQNGVVVGTDIAELLMKNRKQQSSRRGSVVSNNSSLAAETNTLSQVSNVAISEGNSSSSILKEEVVTSKFRDYLIYGSGKEALEWAMKHGLWGHALFLASKLDKRTYANVMTRFANGLTMNDPLQTLYQLLSGKVPAAVTCVADEKWGDWKPHLAMILSNTTQRPELDRKAITTLADTLFSRGSLYAAQFCYLMAQVGFSRYGTEGAKLVLLGSNQNKPFLEFAINEAIQMTEVYEYACSLNDDNFVIPEFLPYKFLLATRLADMGLLEKSLAYLEKISCSILHNNTLAQLSLISQVCQLSDRLKYCDPVEQPFEGDSELDNSRPDSSWLKDLKALERDYNMGLIPQENFTSKTPELEINQTVQSIHPQPVQNAWQQQHLDHQQYQTQWQTPQYSDQQHPSLDYQQTQPSNATYGNDQYQDQQQYWPNQQQWIDNKDQGTGVNSNNQLQEKNDYLQNDYWQNSHEQQEDIEKQQDEVSTHNITISGTLVRKRLTTPTIKPSSSLNSNTSKYALLCTNSKGLSENSASGSENETKSKIGTKKYKIYPFKNRSAEEFPILKTDSFNKKSSSIDSSDYEYDGFFSRRRQKDAAYKSEEKSQLICYKDHTKILAIKNDSKLTKYNTFDLKTNDKHGKMVKYKSLDEPISKSLIKYQDTQVRYQDTRSNVSISAQDFDLSFKLTKFEQKPKRDLITNTVDSWAKKSSKNMFSNIKNSLFKNSSLDKTVVFKPLVFGGTYPIDIPMSTADSLNVRPVNVTSENQINAKRINHKMLLNDPPNVRKYGTPKTFDIDQPI